MYLKPSSIAVILILLVLGFGLSSPTVAGLPYEPVETADIEKLVPPTLGEVAATCSALTTVIYNPKSTVTTFSISSFWDQFTTPEQIEQVQDDIAMSLGIDPTLMVLFLNGSHMCIKLKVQTFEETFGFDPEVPDE